MQYFLLVGFQSSTLQLRIWLFVNLEWASVSGTYPLHPWTCVSLLHPRPLWQQVLAWRTLALNLTPTHLISFSVAIGRDEGETEKKKRKDTKILVCCSSLFKVQEVWVNHVLITLSGCFLLILYPFLLIPNVNLLLWMVLNRDICIELSIITPWSLSWIATDFSLPLFKYLDHCLLFCCYLTSS